MNRYDPTTLQRVDELLAELGIDQRVGTVGDELKTAILDYGKAMCLEGQRLAGEAVWSILNGEVLVARDTDRADLEFTQSYMLETAVPA